jgi:nicotinate dehydrogenase subunit A
MPTIRFRLNGIEMDVDADPDRSLLDILRGRLGMTGPHFGCGGGEYGACNVMMGDRAEPLRHAIVVDRRQGHHNDRDWAQPTSAPAATRFHCRASAAMRLLRTGILMTAAALLKQNPAPPPARSSKRSTATLPLRLAQPHGARGAARGNHATDEPASALAISPETAGQPGSESRLSSWLNFLADGRVTVSPGKVEIGRDRDHWPRSPPTS